MGGLFGEPRRFLPRAGRVLAWCLLAGAGALGLVGFARVLPALARVPAQLDFGAYYVAARALQAGVSPYRPGELDQVAAGVAGVPHSAYLYPPFFAAALRPLALLPYRLAETVWFAANLTLFGLLWVLLLRLVELPPRWRVAVPWAALLLPAVYDTWLLGQVSLLLTVLMVGALVLTAAPRCSARRDLLAGALLGLAAAVKLYPILLAGVYLARRRWAVLLGALLGAAGAGVVGLVFGGGWQTALDWLTSGLGGASGKVAFPSNQSLGGVLARCLTANSFQVPVLRRENLLTVTPPPLLDSPSAAAALTALGSLAVVGLSAWALLRPGPPGETLPLDAAICTGAMLLVTPIVWDLYYVHLLLPLLLLAQAARGRPWLGLVLGLACLLLALQRYWRYLLLYSQSPLLMLWGFLAVLLIWGALLRLRLRQGRPEAQTGLG